MPRSRETLVPTPVRPEPPASPHTLRRLRTAMGTWVAIEAGAGSAAQARAGTESAFAAIRDVEWCMHPHRSGSDLERINSAAVGAHVPISAATREVLELARRLHAASDGVFDPCAPEAPGCLPDLELVSGGWVVPHARVVLDLGGIAKGFAVDRAVAALTAAGCTWGLVNAGGDLRAFGPRSLPVLLRTAGGAARLLALENAALAVSELENTGRPSEHRGYYVRAGALSARVGAAVLAGEAAVADGLTKCVMLCSADTRRRVLRAFGARTLAMSGKS